MRATDETPLWYTVRGASGWVVAGWVVWLAAAVGGAAVSSRAVGPAGAVLAVLAGGWLLARWLAIPPDCERQYHLDDRELTVIGPGQRVRRLAWTDVHSVTQDRRVLTVVGPGVTAVLPLRPLLESDAWFEILRRVVPGIAEAMWATVEERVLRLVPDCDPPTRSLAWWAWLPAVLACAVVTGTAGLGLTLGLVGAERLAALFRARRRTVAVHPAGLSLRSPRHGFFVPWARAEIVPSPGGLNVAFVDRGAGLVSTRLPNFWAAAAVIQLRVRLGADAPAEVHFRVRVLDGGLAVVGEVEAGG